MKLNQLVSIIMPAFNSEKFISKSIQSILNQTYTNWELIIIDDASTDNTYSIIKSYSSNNPKIKVVKNQKNLGPAVSRNLGIDISQGEWIAFCDSDDLWNSEKLEKQMSLIEKYNYDFVFSGYNIINEEGKIISKFIPQKSSYTLHDILKHCDIGILTAIYNKNIFKKCRFIHYEKAEDYTLWIQMLKIKNHAYAIQDVLASYRIRKSSRSSNKILVAIQIWKIYREVVKLNIFYSSYYMMNFFLYFIKKFLFKIKYNIINDN